MMKRSRMRAMSEPVSGQPSDDPAQPQRISHAHTSARVPERVARGIVATGFLAYFGPNEFVIDFLQLIARPAFLAARVVLSPVVAEQFLVVLRENLARYSSQFGAPPVFPKSQGDRPRTPQEVYDDLKIPDDVLSGVYANTVMVGHTPAEFGLDFITSFLPHAAVSARIYIAAPRVPMLVDTLAGLVAQYKRQYGGAGNGSGMGGGPGAGLPPNPPPGGANGFGTAPGIPGFPTPPPAS
jgi:hypothetical protein